MGGCRARRRDDERGAAALVVGITMSLLLIVGAFAVDLGMQRVLRRDLQALADMVALDMSRHLDGNTHAYIKARDTWRSGIGTAIQRNLNDADAPTVKVQQHQQYATATVADEPLVVTVVMGFLNPDGSFREVAWPKDNTARPTAVKVIATSAVGFAFGGLTGIGAGGASRSAVAESKGGACFKIGSYAAALDTGASPVLGPLLGALGSNITLTAADYNALADANVDLLNLVGANVGALTLEEVIEGGELLSLGDFYLATATALAKESGQSAQVALLQSIATSVAPLNLMVPAADLLSLGTGGADGLDAALNVLDLVTAGAAAATGEYGLVIPQAGVNLGPLANVQAGLHVIEAPRMGCGRKGDPGASAQNSAIKLDLSAAAVDLDLGVLDTRVSLAGTVSVASAKGQLTDVRCGPEGITVAVSDGLLSVDLTLEIRIRGIFGLLPAVSGPIRLTGASGSTGDAVVNIGTDADYETPVRVDNDSSGLPNLHVDTTQLRALGLPLGGLLNVIVSPLLDGLVNPLVGALDAALLTPLLRSLGMDLSGADVFAVRRPTCENPSLVG